LALGTALFFTACYWAPEKNQKNAQIMACDKKRKKRFIGPWPNAQRPTSKNKTKGRQKKQNAKMTYICPSSQKQIRTGLSPPPFFLGGVFGRFSPRGVRKHEKQN
jgi:hypothetical protein